MATAVKFIYGTEAQILALTSESELWIDRAFYYPSDKDYFYQLLNGEMKLYGIGTAAAVGIGITLNDKVIGGVKSRIESEDVLTIPEFYEYNVFSLNIEGVINNNGIIHIS
jgi:hypothetical protein